MKFFSYIDYQQRGSLDRIRSEVIACLVEFFDPMPEDLYHIMDPYLDVDASIQRPFKENLIDSRVWSGLLAGLGYSNIEFKIITRETVEAISGLDKYPPFSIPIAKQLGGATVRVCQYLDTKFSGLAIHDRYIVRVRSGVASGLHLGPSLEDILDKDISITEYTEENAKAAVKSFNQIWNECVRTKTWRKG